MERVCDESLARELEDASRDRESLSKVAKKVYLRLVVILQWVNLTYSLKVPVCGGSVVMNGNEWEKLVG